MGNNMFETTSLVAVKNVPHKIFKSPIPLSKSNSKTQTPNENVPQRILIFGSHNKTVTMAVR